jgi:hypothetical protein
MPHKVVGVNEFKGFVHVECAKLVKQWDTEGNVSDNLLKLKQNKEIYGFINNP